LRTAGTIVALPQMTLQVAFRRAQALSPIMPIMQDVPDHRDRYCPGNHRGLGAAARRLAEQGTLYGGLARTLGLHVCPASLPFVFDTGHWRLCHGATQPADALRNDRCRCGRACSSAIRPKRATVGAWRQTRDATPEARGAPDEFVIGARGDGLRTVGCHRLRP